MDQTTFAGLTRVAPGEDAWADGGRFFNVDRDTIDRLLRIAAKTHRHDGSAGLEEPITGPTVTTSPAGGTIPSDTDVYVGFTALDAQGGETLISPLSHVVTPDGGDFPATPTGTADYAAGDLTANLYLYAITAADGQGGESAASDPLLVELEGGHANGRVTLSGLQSAAVAVGGVSWRLYRSVNNSDYGLLATGTTESFTDDCSHCADPQLNPPDDTGDATAGVNSVTARVPTAALPTNAVGFRLYASDELAMPSPALVGDYGLGQLNTDILITTLVGQTGGPPTVSTSVGGATLIQWREPVANVGALPTTSNIAGDVRVVLSTMSLYGWDGDSWEVIGAGGGGGGGGHEIQDEGTSRTARALLNFIGAGVTVYDDAANARTVVNIPGGGGGGGALDWEGEWNAAVDYPQGALVRYQSGLWLATGEPAVGEVPGEDVEVVDEGGTATDPPVFDTVQTEWWDGSAVIGHVVEHDGAGRSPTYLGGSLPTEGIAFETSPDMPASTVLIQYRQNNLDGGGAGMLHVDGPSGGPVVYEGGDYQTVGSSNSYTGFYLEPGRQYVLLLGARNGSVDATWDYFLSGASPGDVLDMTGSGGGTHTEPSRWELLLQDTSASSGSTPGHVIVSDSFGVRPQRTYLRITGAGVTVSDDSFNNRTTVTIPGATSSGGTELSQEQIDAINQVIDAGGVTVDVPWQAVELASGWTPQNDGPQVKVDRSGFVHLQGAAQITSGASGAGADTLPFGTLDDFFRPVGTIRIPVAAGTSGLAIFYADETGEMSIVGALNDGDVVAVDGVVFDSKLLSGGPIAPDTDSEVVSPWQQADDLPVIVYKTGHTMRFAGFLEAFQPTSTGGVTLDNVFQVGLPQASPGFMWLNNTAFAGTYTITAGTRAGETGAITINVNNLGSVSVQFPDGDFSGQTVRIYITGKVDEVMLG